MHAQNADYHTSGDLVVDGLCVRRGGTLIITSATFSVPSGTVTGLVGRNGAGKSTLLNAMVTGRGVDAGRITTGRRVRYDWNARDSVAAGVFWWPQDGFLSAGLTLREHLVLADRHYPGLYDRFAFEAERLRIGASVMHTRVRELSTGERRCVEAAIVLAARPRIVIADEPFVAMAPNVIDTVAPALTEMSRHGAAILVSTHQWWVVASWADRVAWVSSGSVREFATVEAASSDWQFRREFLGPHPAGRPG